MIQEKKTILISPDKFRGSLQAQAICQTIKQGISSKFKTISLPLADGGQGSIDLIAKCIKCQLIRINTIDPLFREIIGYYYISQDHKIAYIQLAKCSGLSLLKKQQLNPQLTTTKGTGILIRHAIQNMKVQTVYLFIGGSATNDGGIGIISELGYEFLDKNNQILSPIGENLISISKINVQDQQLVKKVSQITFKILCDVNNPLTGTEGSAKVYAKQKGATLEQIEKLDRGLQNYDSVIQQKFGKSVNNIPGSGAAGGVGAGCLAFLNAQMRSGADEILKIIDYQGILKKNSIQLVVTGQGKVDNQTLHGKLVNRVIAKNDQFHIKTLIVCGVNQLNEEEMQKIYKKGVIKVLSLTDEAICIQKAMKQAKQILFKKISEFFENFVENKEIKMT